MQLNKDLKKYPAYKDSGIAWIGEIPDNWIIKKIKNNFSITSGSTPDSSVPAYWNGDITWITPADYKTEDKIIFTSRKNLSSAGYDACGTTLVPPKSIIFSKRAPIGAVALAGKHLCTNQGCLACIPFKDINPLFYYYVFSVYSSVFELYGSGTTFKEISMSDFANFKIVCPPASEQQAIADYLDEKCGAIDKAIDTEKDIIEKLKEYKQSIITETVTKGLDKSAPMKDSGIPWIGQIPQHWAIVELKTLFNFIGGYAFKSDDYVEQTGNQVIRIGNIRNDKLLLDEKQIYITNVTANNASNMLIMQNDILFSMTGTKGKRDYFYTVLIKDEHVKDKKLYLNQRVGCFRKKIDIDERYFNYLLKENKILDSIFIYETGTANQGNLGIETIRNTKLHYPPKDEQQKIADYLDEKCSKIDKVLADKEQVIEKLTEYKKSLIYECVTGKRRVA